MKNKSLLFLVLFCTYAFSQETDFIYNQAEFKFSNDGSFFHEFSEGLGGYYPEGTEHKVFYYAGLNIGARSNEGDLLASYCMYLDNSFAPGPVAMNYEDSLYQVRFDESIWIVTKSQVETHKVSFWDPLYETPDVIKNWPGNGNVENGESTVLAPFFDNNGNGVYEPNLGDYPCIKGDKCAFLILNDLNYDSITPQPVGVEVHLMFYQFLWPDVINQTTFLNTKVINKSNESLNDLRVGIFSDMDIGGMADDFMGTDTLRNLFYTYNGDIFDQTHQANLGFESNAPAVGLKLLNEKLYSTMYIDVRGTNGVNEYPTSYGQVNAYLNAHFVNCLSLTYGGEGFDPQNPLTRYFFSGYRDEGWTETSALNHPGDRTGMLSTGKSHFLPNESVSYDFAVVYGRPENPDDIWDAVDVMFENADIVQEFYDNMDQSCQNETADISEFKEIEFQVYPNPANDEVFVQLNGSFEFEVYNVFGKQVIQKSKGFQQEKIDLSHCAAGVYFVKVMQDGHSSIKKLILK